MTVNATGLFCSDVRDEVGGTVSLVGIYPDNIEVQSIPGLLPQLAFYVRMHFTPDEAPRDVRINLTDPEGTVFDLGGFSNDLIADSAAKAKVSGLPIAGVYLTGKANPFNIAKVGTVVISVSFGITTVVAAALNIKLAGT